MTKKLLETAVNLGYINQEQAMEVCREAMKSGLEMGIIMTNKKMISDSDLINLLMQTISVPKEKNVYKANKKKEPKLTKKQIQKNAKFDKEIHDELIDTAYAFMLARAHGNKRNEEHLFVIQTISDYRENPSDKCPINCHGNKELQKRADKNWELFTKFSPEQMSDCMIQRIHSIFSDEKVEG